MPPITESNNKTKIGYRLSYLVPYEKEKKNEEEEKNKYEMNEKT